MSMTAHYPGDWTRNVIGRVMGPDTAKANYIAIAATFDPTAGSRGTTTVRFRPLPLGETRIVNSDTGARLTAAALTEYLPPATTPPTVDTDRGNTDRTGTGDP